MKLLKISKKSVVSIIVIVGVVLIASCIIYNIPFSKQSNESDLFPKNSNGQTYGSAMYAESQEELPDLILVMGKHGNVGYIYKDDYLNRTNNDYERYSSALSPKQLKKTRELYKDKYPNVEEMDFYDVCYDVPVYDETGINVIDEYTFTIGTYPY